MLKNSTALTVAVLLERGIAFFLPWYVARVQGPGSWGNYSLALTFVMITAPLAFWGLDQLLPREIARNPEEVGVYLANALAVGGGVSIIATGIAIATVYLLGYPTEVESLAYIGLALVIFPRTEATICEAAIGGLERMEWIPLVRFPITLLRVIGSIILLSQGVGLHILFVFLALYHVLATIVYLLLLKRYIPYLRLHFNAGLMRRLALQTVPFVVTVFVGELFRQLDRIFLSKTDSTDSVGIYTSGIMLVEMMYIIAPSIMQALFPGMSRVYVASKRRFSDLVSKLFKFLFVGTFPIMLTIIAFADLVILIAFGQEYRQSIPVLQIYALGIVPSFTARIMYRTVLASNNERFAVVISFMRSAANLLLNIWLIPRYGVIGAAISAACVELFGLAQNLAFASWGIVTFDFKRALWMPGLCAAASALTYLLLYQWSRPAAWLASLGVYAGVIFLSGTFSGAEVRTLLSSRAPAPVDDRGGGDGV